MKLLISAAVIAFVAATSAVAQSGGGVSSPSSRAAKDQAENRITAQLNEQQLAKVTAATNTTSVPIPQTAAQPTDCSPNEANCTPGGTAR